jgi:hypothetical protein
MRKLLLAATASIMLSGCSNITGPPDPQAVADAIKNVCGIVVSVSDVSVLLTAGTNPLLNTANSWAHVVCDAYKTQVAGKRLAADQSSGTVIVNGVPIKYEKK